MADRHLIVGAGAVGRHVAQLLTERGSRVHLATRSGTDTGIDGVEHETLDATDVDELTAALEGVDVLYNCANPANYTQWESMWPPLARSLLMAAERSGTVYVITGNLYPFGPVDGPMVESLADAATDSKGRIRAWMWKEALSRHQAGQVRAVEVRGSDFLGHGIGAGGHLTRHIGRARRGRRAWVVGSPDQPHTFTDVLDQARTMIAAAEDPTAHGRTWLTPSNPPVSPRAALMQILAAGGLAPVAVSSIPALGLLAKVNGFVGEVAEIAYMWRRPYVVDDSAARTHFGLEPTPWDQVCHRTLVGN
ncbi:MAG: NAD-dependent epimerase/dehydratase family protein [Beutenbergiaceae bacterium]